MIRAGGQVRITRGDEKGQLATIWSPAPSLGTYWAHLSSGRLVLIKVRMKSSDVTPTVTVEEEQA
jgi:hypothetical protein